MLQGRTAPLRVVLQRSFADWLIVAATWLVILCATTLVAVGILYGDAVALSGLRQVIGEHPPTAITIEVAIRASGDELAEVEPKIERQLGRILGWTGGELITTMQSESYALPDQGRGDRTDLAVFGSYEAIDRYAGLTDGAWPAADAEPMQVAPSVAAAKLLGLSLGDELELTSQRENDRSLTALVVGTWEPHDPSDPYWRSDPFVLNGVAEGSSFTTFGPLVVANADLVERTASGEISLEYLALPEFDRLAVEDVKWMRSDTAVLERRLSDALGERAFFQVSTELDSILDDVGRSLLVSRSGVVVLTIQYAVLAGYALLLVAGLLVEQRRIETALLRSRGAGVGQVTLMSLLEALLLVVPAALAAPWIAIAALNLLNVAGPLAEAGIRIEPRVNDAALTAVAIAGAAAVVGLILPGLASGRGLSTVRQSLARQGSRTLAQRLGIDIALVVLAGVGLWQLRQYGAPLTATVRGEFGIDPLLVAAPAIGLLAGSIVALRLVPLLAEIGERVLGRRRGLVPSLGARQVSRRPLRYTRSALLLMLAAALGTFAGAYASTWTRSQSDQAAYRTGADVRVVVSDFPDLPASAIGAAYRSVAGVEAATPVVRETFDMGDQDGNLLAVDTATVAEAIRFRPDLASQPFGDMLAALRATPSEETRPIPALVGAMMMETTGVAVGDTIDLGTLGSRRTYVITGTLAGWPTLDPGRPFVVADLSALVAWDSTEGRAASVDEWWLATSRGSASTVAETLRGEPYSAESVMAYDDLHRELLNDPVALGVIGSLALGALAAVVFAAIGFVVSATVSARERLGEFALLQAIGLSHCQLSAWLSMENAFLLVFGLAAGTGLGLILAWIVLPFVTLTQEASIAVPPVEVVIPWDIYALLYLAALGALAVTVVVIGNLLARVRVSGVLRSAGE